MSAAASHTACRPPRRHGGGRRRCQGVSLVEVVIATALMLLIASSAVVLGTSTTNAYRTSTAVAGLDSAARRAVDEIAEALLPAALGTITPVTAVAPVSSSWIEFKTVAGFAGGAPVSGDVVRIEFRYEPGETDDGTDEDGDGLVDEGQVVLVERPGEPDERVVVLCSGVAETLQGEIPGNGIDDNGNGLLDEPGLCFDLEGGTVNVRLTVQRTDAEGRVLTKTVRRTVRPRNTGGP